VPIGTTTIGAFGTQSSPSHGGGFPGVPESFLFLGGVGQLTNTPTNEPIAQWSVDSSAGSDIALNVDTTTIEILTNGLYAWTTLWGFDSFDPGNPASGTTGIGTWTPFMQQLTGTSFGSFSATMTGLGQVLPCSVALPLSSGQSFNWTGWMDAGDTFNFYVAPSLASTNVTNWRIESDPNTLCLVTRVQ
jgi:hypothetical protein